MRRILKVIALVTAGAVVIGAAFAAGRAWAAGIPGIGALSYSGTLQDTNGTPLTGSRNIQVNLWGTATGGTTPLCQTASTAISLKAGRFAITLPDACTATVKGNPNTWIEVLVEGASLGRTKIGAVPYAVEAGHATSADSATTAGNAAAATGALQTTLDQVQAAITAAESNITALQGRALSCTLTIGESTSSEFFPTGTSAAQCAATEFLTGCSCGSDSALTSGVPLIQTTNGSSLANGVCACRRATGSGMVYPMGSCCTIQ